MGTKHCVFPGCNSDSRYYHKPHMKDVTFVSFPKLKSKPNFCNQWVNWLTKYKPGFSVNDVKYSTYLCSKHLSDEFFKSQLWLPALRKPSPVISILGVLGPSVSILKSTCLNTTSLHELSPRENITSPKNSQVSILKPMGDSFGNHEETATLDIVATEMKPDISFLNLVNNQDSVALEKTILNSNNIGDNSSCISTDNFEEYSMVIGNTENHHLEKLSPNIKDFFCDYAFPEDWALIVSDFGVKMSKINYETNGVIISIDISPEYNFSLRILNVYVPEHALLPNLPTKIESTEQLTQILNNLEKLSVCDGIHEDKYKNIFSQKNAPNGQFCWYTKSIRHKACSLLSQLKTCSNCAKLRSYFRGRVFRQARERRRISSFKSLTMTEMIQELKKAKNNEILLKRKLRRKDKELPS